MQARRALRWVMVALVGCATAVAQAPKAGTELQKADHLFREGSAAFSAGNYKLAHSDFARLVRLAPHIAAAHTAFGAVLLAEGQPLEAVKELEAARRLDSKDVPTAINLGVGYRQLSRNADAVGHFRVLPAGRMRCFLPPKRLRMRELWRRRRNQGRHRP